MLKLYKLRTGELAHSSVRVDAFHLWSGTAVAFRDLCWISTAVTIYRSLLVSEVEGITFKMNTRGEVRAMISVRGGSGGQGLVYFLLHCM